MVCLKGRRILLREWRRTADDLEAMHAWLGDPRVTRFLDWGARDLAESREHLELCLREQSRPDRERYFLAVEHAGSGEVLGDAGVSWRSRADGEGGIGYFLRPEHWGRGYGAEAAGLVIDFCFEVLGMHRLSASCDAGNRASERVMQKCGMRREAELRQAERRFGEWRNRLVYGMLRDEWEALEARDAR